MRNLIDSRTALKYDISCCSFALEAFSELDGSQLGIWIHFVI